MGTGGSRPCQQQSVGKRITGQKQPAPKNTLVHIYGNDREENSWEMFQSGLLQLNHDES